MPRSIQASFMFVLLLAAMTCAAQAGAAAGTDSPSQPDAPSQVNTAKPTFVDTLPPGTDPENNVGWPLIKHLAGDQLQFWTSPVRIKRQDAKILAPFAGFTSLLVLGDSWFSRQVPDKPDQLTRSRDISQYGIYSMIGAAGGAYLWGRITKNDHLQEAGFLSGEAALNSTAVTYALKGITQRERPLDGDGSGHFFVGGASFPSEHSTIAWSIASVMAHEYPGPLTQIAAYGLASAISLTRVTGREHFPSDIFVGSALGWYIGRQVYRAHHDTELGGAPWGGLLDHAERAGRSLENMGSPYVPLDSWIYPGLERLAALGYIQTAYLGVRPWTRLECTRLLEEAEQQLQDGEDTDDEAGPLYAALRKELSPEAKIRDGSRNLGITLDSIYARVMGISGPPLNDSFHFGQTILADYGRPYGEGFNAITGLSAHAEAGPFSLEFQGEYQHAAATPSYSADVLQAIADRDQTLPLANGTNTVDRIRLINASVGFTWNNVKFSFGKQTSWLGPGEGSPLLLSDNAPSITMLRIDSVAPFDFPLLSRVLGPARSEFFIGQLAGHHWVFANTHLAGPDIDPQPYLHSAKLSFHPTPNLEFGMGITAMFSGPGLPFTWANFLRTYYSHKADVAEKPGKRFSAFDFTYRVPGLRKWLSIYNDSLVVDEISPIGSTRPTLSPGLYMPQVPGMPKLQLRFEAQRSAHTHEFGPGFVYSDRRYLSGYTSDGSLLASWIGRAGLGGRAWATYSFTPRSSLQLAFRHVEVDRNFLSGGHLNDFGARTEILLREDLSFTGSVQYERWAFPLLAAEPKSNVTASFQLTFMPHWRMH